MSRWELKLKYSTQFLKCICLQAAPILDNCQSIIVKSEDQCDNCFRAYKCFWEGVKQAEANVSRDGLRFSLYDVLGFNRLYDEEEVLAETEVSPDTADDVTEI